MEVYHATRRPEYGWSVITKTWFADAEASHPWAIIFCVPQRSSQPARHERRWPRPRLHDMPSPGNEQGADLERDGGSDQRNRDAVRTGAREPAYHLHQRM